MVKHALPLLLLMACADDPCPRGDMRDSKQGLVVTQAEHPTGWGQSECAACHATAALHQQACSEGVDMDAVRDLLDTGDADDCTSCHGGNGVGQ